jgi:hypothetical protein
MEEGPLPKVPLRYRLSRSVGSRIVTVHTDECGHCRRGFGHWVANTRPTTMEWVPDEDNEGFLPFDILPAWFGMDGEDLTLKHCGHCLHRAASRAVRELRAGTSRWERAHVQVMDMDASI